MFSNRIGFGPRLGAAILDIVFITLLCVPLMLIGGIGTALVSALGLEAMVGDEEAEALALIGIGTGMLVMVLLASIIALTYTLIEALTGASPGKRVMGLQVAREDGSRGDMQLYLLRWALKNSGNLLTFVLPGISSIASMVFFFGSFAALGDKKQALHDMIVKSAVYKKADITG